MIARFELFAFARQRLHPGLESSRNRPLVWPGMFATPMNIRGYIVTKDEQMELGKKLIGEMRAAFARSDWDETTSTYEQMEGIKTDRAINLEATCLAVRALVAVKERGAARQLLAKVSTAQYKKPAHYEFLARAYLDLKRYKEAAAACERAEELRIAELK